MQAETLAETNTTHSKPYLTKTDVLFLIFVSLVVACIAWIGYSIWDDEVRSQRTQENGERLSAWMADKGKKRDTQNALSPCEPKTMHWAECRALLVASDGPFSSVKNEFGKDNLVFAPSCQRSQENTLGAIIMQKGTAKPDGSGYSYAPLPDEEPLEAATPMRLSICARAFSVVHIAEFVF